MEAGFSMSKHDEVVLAETIRQVFAYREPPTILSTSSQLSQTESLNLAIFAGFEWDKVDGDMWEKYFDLISLLSPEAFCYYLPGICNASLREHRPDLIVVSAVIGMLDRSPSPEWWDDFFLQRWPQLTAQECRAIQEWVWWLTSLPGTSYEEESLMRALHTLELLITQKALLGVSC